MDEIESEVKRILDKDVKFGFVITGTEIDACERLIDLNAMVKEYLCIIETVLMSRIVNKNPRFIETKVS